MSAAERIRADARARIAVIRKVEKLKGEIGELFDVQWPNTEHDNIDTVLGALLALLEDAPLRKPGS